MEIIETKKLDKIKKLIKDSNAIFILSTKKPTSKQLFEELIKDVDIVEKYGILVENLTGGRGKILFMAKKFDKKVIIGGYDFYFNLIGNGITFDKVVIYEISGPMQEVMKKDIRWRKI